MNDRHRLLVLGLTLGLLSCTTPSARADNSPTPETITIRDETMQVWPFDDLRARGFDIPDIPREENAFWTYLEAINGYVSLPPELRSVFDYATNTWPTGQDEALSAYVLDPRNQNALELVRTAAAMDQCQLYYFGNSQSSAIGMMLPSLRDFRNLAMLLVVDGQRLAAQGEYEAAFDDYAAALRMAHHVGGGITLIENLVGVAVFALGNQATLQMMLHEEPSSAELRDILGQLRELSALQPSMARGLQTERLFLMNAVDEIVTSPRYGIGALGIGPGGAGVRAARELQGWNALLYRAKQIVLPDRTVKRHIGAYFEEIIRRTNLPAYEARWAEFDDANHAADIPQWDIIAHALIPSLSRTATQSEICRMQSRMTRIVVALRLCTLNNDGRPPERLADLQQWLPPDDLMDPFSGEEFVYERTPDGWRIYSVSKNLVDDGGSVSENDRFLPDYVIEYPPDEIEPYSPPDTQESAD